MDCVGVAPPRGDAEGVDEVDGSLEFEPVAGVVFGVVEESFDMLEGSDRRDDDCAGGCYCAGYW